MHNADPGMKSLRSRESLPGILIQCPIVVQNVDKFKFVSHADLVGRVRA
jgi:hypothetical protein